MISDLIKNKFGPTFLNFLYIRYKIYCCVVGPKLVSKITAVWGGRLNLFDSMNSPLTAKPI